MAAFVLFVVAVAGGIVVADLVWENPTTGQINGVPPDRRRAGRKQLRRLRRGLEDQVAAPEPDQAYLLDAFFGPEVPSRHLDGLPRPVHFTGERVEYPPEPLYEQARR